MYSSASIRRYGVASRVRRSLVRVRRISVGVLGGSIRVHRGSWLLVARWLASRQARVRNSFILRGEYRGNIERTLGMDECQNELLNE